MVIKKIEPVFRPGDLVYSPHDLFDCDSENNSDRSIGVVIKDVGYGNFNVYFASLKEIYEFNWLHLKLLKRGKKCK